MILALDCETSKKPTFKPWQKEAYLSTVATLTSTNETTFTVFHHNEQSEQDWITDKCKASNLQHMLDSAECVVGSNLKFDLLWLRHIGIKYDKIRLFDTQVAEYLLTYHSNKDLGLDALARKYIGSSKLDIVRTQYWDADVNTADVPLDILRTYNVDDCKLSLLIAEKQRVLLQEKGMMKVFSVEMEKLKLLADIEYNGMKIDVDELTRQKKENYEALARCEQRIQEIIGLQFNIESNDQLSVALFGGTYYTEGSEEVSRTLKNGTIKKYTRKCDIPVEFKGYGFIPEKSWAASKEGFYHTSKDVLSLLKHQCKSKESKELVALLVERSAISQRIKTFLDGLEGRLEDGVLHCTMNNTVTATGRLSSSNPNTQNLPRGSSSDIKKFFVSKKGRLVSCDASQLEWRVAAFLSQCPVMLYEIENGIDQHAATGQDIFGGKGERTDWKIFNFRMIKTLILQVAMPVENLVNSWEA